MTDSFNAEDPIPGVVMTLWKDTNGDDVPDVNTGMTSTTNSSGMYLFEGLSPGDYIVQAGPDNFDFGGVLRGFSTSSGNDPVADPDDNVNNDDNGYDPGLEIGIISKAITLASAMEPINDGDIDPNSNLTVDFGFFEAVRLGDYVWMDADADGVQDNEEEGINGVTVILHNADNDAVVAETLTAQDPQNATQQGHYTFENLAPGNYYVEFVPPAGKLISPANNTPDDTEDSDIDGTNGPNTTQDYTLLPGGEDLTIDAGFYTPALIGDFVWVDFGEANVQDPDDIGINGVMVTLYEDGPLPGPGDLMAVGSMPTMNNPETGEQGWYQFDNLPTGSYLVEFELPEDFSYVVPNQGGDDNTDSDVVDFITGRTLLFPVNPGDTLRDIDAGLQAATVPVELLSFTGRWNRNKDVNELYWTTASEVNNDYFSVERSFNGSEFEEIGIVEGSGNSLVEVNYGFDDDDNSANGLYSYRLRQVDYDGSFEYSGIVNINVERDAIILTQVYPNPASQFINIDITVTEQSDIEINLLDVTGKLIRSRMGNINSISGREKVKIDIDDIPGGTYILRVNIGDKVFNHKVLLLGK